MAFSTDSPNPWKEAKLHRPTMATLGVGVTGEGIKRWGIEGIRIGNFDRFGRAEANY